MVMEANGIIRLTVFFAVLCFMIGWETYAPRRSLTQKRTSRWATNFSIVLINSLLVRLLLPTAAIGSAIWANEHDMGLLNMLDMPYWLLLFVAIILLDLAIYVQHVVIHAVPLLWRLHMVHHADRDIDVSTGLRFHPLEIVLSMLIKMTVVVLLGAPAEGVLIFEIILNGMAMFNHANAYLPKSLDAVLRLCFVTPDMHRVHHSVIKDETNSNFGFNLSIWDRLFGTYRAQPQQGHDNMQIGLSHLQHAPSHRLGYILLLPFRGSLGQYPFFSSDRRPPDQRCKKNAKQGDADV